MPLLEAVRLALATIRVQKLKSFFTILGVTIAVMFLITVVSIVEGMSRYMEEDFAGRILGANTFTLRRFPWYGDATTEEEWRRWQRHPRFYLSDVPAIASALPPGTRYAVEGGEFLRATSKFQTRPRQVEARAVEGDFFLIKKYDIARGRVFTEHEAALGTPVVVIGHDVAERFFPNLDPVGYELRIEGFPFEVIGVIEKQGSLFGISLDRLAIAPFRSPLSRRTNPRGDIDDVLVQGRTVDAMTEAMERVREALRGRRRLRPGQPDNFAMETSASALAEFEEMKGVMNVAGSALPAIGLVVGGLVIMNIMLVSVAERTREIGIRKSLGAKRRDILSQFLVESATLSTLGAVVGIVLGLVAAQVIAALSPLPASVNYPSLVLATLLGTVVGIVSGVYPARRAARLDPIQALRAE